MSARKTVKFKLDLKNRKPLSNVQRKRLAALAATPDAAIDYGDIPKKVDAGQWSRTRRLG